MSDMVTPLVSVIIPTYNRAVMTVEAIQSVLSQTYTNFEIIVVDDGSTDNTRDVVAQIDDKRLRYIYQDNARQAAARNHGIEVSKGDYVAFLDSDDLFFPEKLAQQVQYLVEHPQVGLLYSGYTFCGKQENIKTIHYATLSGQPIAQIMTRMEIATPSVIMPRHVFDIVGNFDTTLPGVEDLEFWVRVACHFEIASMPEPLVEIRVNSINPNRNVRRRLNNTLRVWDKIFAQKPNIGWLEQRKLYALPYYLAVSELSHLFPNLPDDINPPLVLGICLRVLYYYPFKSAYHKVVWRMIFRMILPSKLYLFFHSIWNRQQSESE